MTKTKARAEKRRGRMATSALTQSYPHTTLPFHKPAQSSRDNSSSFSTTVFRKPTFTGFFTSVL